MEKLIAPFQRYGINLINENDRKRAQIKLRHLLISAINRDPEVKVKGMKPETSSGHASRAYEAYHCGDIRDYLVDKDEKHKRGNGGLYCHERLCTICARIKSLKNRVKLSTLLNYLNQHYRYKNGNPRYSLIFLTLSVPNSANDWYDFRRVHRLLAKKFRRLLKYKRYDGFSKRDGKKLKGICLGAVGKIEGTYNNHLDSWNLHLHALLLVHRSYFWSRYYVPFKQWRSDWERANRWSPLDHNGKHLQICVERPYYKDFNGKRHHLSSTSTKGQRRRCRHSASCELTAYETKSVDFAKILRTSGKTKQQRLAWQQHTFDTAYFGLKHQKTYTFIGLFKKLNRMYKNGKLDAYKPRDKYEYKYQWNTKFSTKLNQYQTTDFSKLTKEQLLDLRETGLRTVFTKTEQKYYDKFKIIAIQRGYRHPNLHTVMNAARSLGKNALYSGSQIRMLGGHYQMFG